MHYLITGHTGFKGSWLTVLLREMGHRVSGISLPPVSGGLFEEAVLSKLVDSNNYIDIRQSRDVSQAVRAVNPDVIIHMAAQPLVLRSYEDPIETFEVNVDGTRNVIEAASGAPGVELVLIVTTDKVYRDDGSGEYSEKSPLGGHDPYSASKAMADIMAQSYANLGLPFKLGVARAGNVIGRGDVSVNRLVPDAIRALRSDSPLKVRMPSAVRPWQHVLDCLSGYVSQVEFMLRTDSDSALVLNIGPDPSSYRRVAEVVSTIQTLHPELKVDLDVSHSLKESEFLTLNSSAARNLTGWRDRLSFEDAVAWSVSNPTLGFGIESVIDQTSKFLAAKH